MADELVNLTASEAAAEIACGAVSAEDYTRACLERIEALDGEIKAFVHLDRDHALAQARRLDEHRKEGHALGRLHGIPVAIKDNYDTVDMRTTAGAVADYANDKPPKDATMVEKLRAAGAIILGKTNLDEYAPAGIGRSTLGGQTCNPYDTKRITGGSSAGTAAAVAANLAICGLGTDTAGSVRYPSSLDALVGLVAT